MSDLGSPPPPGYRMAAIRESKCSDRSFHSSSGAPPACTPTAPRSRHPFSRRVLSRFRFTCIGAVALSLCLSAFGAKKVAEPGVTPIQAELMADLNARLLKVGSPVYARVAVDWIGTGCVLRKGAVLEAHVVSVAPYNRSTKLSELDLAFTHAQCAAPKMAALDLLLAAMSAPPRISDLGILSDPVPFATSFSGPNNQAALSSLRAGQLSANVNLKLGLDSSVYDFPALPRMHMGDVSGIHGLKLSVGSGIGNSSVLGSRRDDVTLEKHTLLLLVPAEGTYPRSASESGTAPPALTGNSVAAAAAAAPEPGAVPSPARPSDVPADDVDLCDPEHCNVDLPPGEEIDGGNLDSGFQWVRSDTPPARRGR
jgi:hypothetical protein